MRSALALLAALVAGVALAAQATDQQKPVFRSQVELVAVDVTVLDTDGRPVPDLTLDDFTLRVDGKSRRLVSAQFVPLGAAARPVPSGVTVRHYSTNADAAGGRLIVFVVDRANIRRGEGRPLMKATSDFIGRLEPTDRIALAVIPDSGPYADFTTSHQTIQRQIETLLGSGTAPLATHTIGLSEALAIAHQDIRTFDQVVGRECSTAGMSVPLQSRTGTDTRAAEAGDALIRGCEGEVRAEARLLYMDARQRTSASLAALRDLMVRLSLMSGPKTLVLLSEGLFADTREPGEFEAVAAAAAVSNTTLYALGLDVQRTDASMEGISPTFNNDRVLRLQGLEMLAGMARGRAFEVATGARAVFDRIRRELSGYYLLGFEPQETDRDGGAHVLDIDVRRPGVDVRARRHFLVDRDSSARPAADVLAEILRTPLPATELLMRVATFTLPSEDRQVRLVIAAEIEGATAAGAIPTGFSLTDARGGVAGAEVEGPSASAVLADGKYEYLATFVAAPGDYTLKVAAVDDLGRRGSVEHHFTAALAPAGQLRVGDLLLADAAPGLGRDVRPSIDARITSDEMLGYVELSSQVASLLDGATVELQVAPTDDGAAVARAETRIQAPAVNRRVAEGHLPTDLLPPGEYVARAVVSANGRAVVSVTRPFRLERPLEPRITPRAPAARGAAAPRLRGPAGIAGVEAFDPQRVLRSDVVGYFLDRLPPDVADSLSPAVVTAAAAARRGAWDEVEPALAGVGDTDLTAEFLRGLVLLSRGDLDPAAHKFRQTVRLSHDFFAAAFYIGACYATAGSDDEAAAAWQTALIAETEGSFVFEVLGDALLRQEEGQQAVDILTEAHLLWPDEPGFARRLAVADAVARKHGDAIAVLEPYLAKRPDDADAWMLGAWLVYDARLSGHPLGGLDEDLARIGRYRERYAALGGADAALIDQWAEAVKRKK